MALGRINANIRIGGLMRCCTGTIADDAAAAPTAPNIEGEILQCKYAPEDPNHRMIYDHGTWRWYKPEEQEPAETGLAEQLMASASPLCKHLIPQSECKLLDH